MSRIQTIVRSIFSFWTIEFSPLMGGFRPGFMVLIVERESVQIMTFAKFLYVTNNPLQNILHRVQKTDHLNKQVTETNL